MKRTMAQWTALIARLDDADRKRDEYWEQELCVDHGGQLDYILARVQCDRIDLAKKKSTMDHDGG